jgi:uncharacterized SAM-binding protein YcdF (DUF218 family)
MSFTASKILWWIANPGNLLVTALTLGLLCLLLGRRRLGLGLLILATASCIALTLLPVRVWVLRPLENRFPFPQALDHVDGVIVLGGMINAELSADRGQPVLTDSAERLVAFADLARRFPQAKLVFTGGSASLFDDDREADVARTVMAQIGIDPGRVEFERNARNTYENALFSQRLVDPQPGEVWVMVTSAYHMPRAVGIFRQVGWTVVPYPVDYSVRREATENGFSLTDALYSVQWGVREWIGLVFYWLSGRTSALFPAP